MFTSARAVAHEFEIVAITRKGSRVELPLDSVFDYTRGFTELRVPHNAKALRKPWGRAKPGSWSHGQRREFALWLAGKAAQMRGLDVVGIEFWRRTEHLRSGRRKRISMGRFDLEESQP